MQKIQRPKDGSRHSLPQERLCFLSRRLANGGWIVRGSVYQWQIGEPTGEAVETVPMFTAADEIEI